MDVWFVCFFFSGSKAGDPPDRCGGSGATGSEAGVPNSIMAGRSRELVLVLFWAWRITKYILLYKCIHMQEDTSLQISSHQKPQPLSLDNEIYPWYHRKIIIRNDKSIQTTVKHPTQRGRRSICSFQGLTWCQTSSRNGGAEWIVGGIWCL